MRFRCALIATGLVGAAAGVPAARADDPRDAFGLSRKPPAPPAGCGDGLGFDCAVATDPLDAATPYGLATWLPASYLRRLPVNDATHDQVASFALGAARDEAGVMIGGASGLENRWTIDGAPADSLRTGAADNPIPLAFLDGIYVATGGFSARDRASTGGAIDARLRRGTAQHEVDAELWTQLSRAPSVRPIASGSFTVRRATSEPRPEISAAVVATGPIPQLAPLLGGGSWYAAGIAPRIGGRSVTWRASRQLDLDHDAIPDGQPGDLIVAPIETTETATIDYAVPVMVRLGRDDGPHHIELSLVGQASHDASFLGNATLRAAGIDRSATTVDAIATWRGEWPDTRARIQLAWHRTARDESARDPRAADIPQLAAGYVPGMLDEDPALAAICDDLAIQDPTPLIANCPVPFGFFSSGGAGLLTDTTANRPSATGEIAHRIGDHTLRAGLTGEDSRLELASSYTGHELDFSVLSPGDLSRRRFYHGTCSDEFGGPCDIATGSLLTYRAVYGAAFVEDTFQIRDDLAIDAGVRWELMWVGTRLHFSHQIAPRVGAVWDPLGGGRSRVWASYGRSYAMLPPGLGATVIQRDATVEDLEFAGGSARARDAGGSFGVARGTDPITQDEIGVGAEVALAGALRATVWGQGRFLRHGLETTGGVFGNPGDGGEVKATRETELAAFQLELRRRDAISIRTGVMWGRTVGTWTGPFDPRIGATQLQGPDWDFDPSNLRGALPTDSGGRVFVEIDHRRALGDVALSIATRLTAGSGRPRSVLTDGQGAAVELLPRGAAGRNPVVAQADVRMAARWRGVDVTLDVSNLFDRREVTNLDELYTSSSVRPISGGTTSDLVFLKDDLGSPARRRTAFQLPTAYQSPLSVALGVRMLF